MFAAARSCANVRQDGSSGKSVSGSFAHEETDTARTHLTKHGPLGCRAGLALARDRFCRCCCCQTTVVLFPAPGAFPGSGAIRCLSPVSALCPFFMGVDAGISGTQTRMVVGPAPQFTNRALGIWKEELQDGSHQPRPRRLVVRRAFDLHVVQIDA